MLLMDLGFFPITHSSSIILQTLDDELEKQNVCVECNVNIKEIKKDGIFSVYMWE